MATLEQKAEELVLILSQMRPHFASVLTSKLSRKGLDFTVAQFIALMVVADRKRCTMSDIKESLSITGGSATSLVNKLVDMGILTRRHLQEDRRVVVVKLTEKGKKVFNQIQNENKNIMKHVLQALTVKEVDQLIHIYKKLSKHIMSGAWKT